MSGHLDRSRRPVLLAAGVGSARKGSSTLSAVEPTYSWQVDETVVAFARAAIARGIPLAVPMDLHYAPLVAHVACEYVSPEVAEGESLKRFDGERGDGLRAVSFVSLRGHSALARRRRPPGWTEVFRRLRVVSEDVQPLQEFIGSATPLGAVGIGQGPTVSALFRASSSMQLSRWRLAVSADAFVPQRTSGELLAPAIEQELVALREKLIIVPVGEGSRLRQDSDEPPARPAFFRAYPPLALYAQLLVERLAGEVG